MPQPKPSLLDRIFGPKRRESVPRTFKKEHELEFVGPAEPVEPEPVVEPPPPRSSDHGGLRGLSDDDHHSAQLNSLVDDTLAKEKALLCGMAQQQQQTNYTQAFNAMQQMTGASNQYAGDPDPRQFLPYWRRHYGDLGRNFGGGK